MNTDSLPEKSEFFVYGNVKIKVLCHNENIWLKQEDIAKLFDIDRSGVTKHLKNLFKSEELKKSSVCANLAHTDKNGKKSKMKHYSLDAAIAVSLRVNSDKAKLFRVWAIKKLSEFIIKGYVLDTQRLNNNGQHFKKNYSNELQGRINKSKSAKNRQRTSKNADKTPWGLDTTSIKPKVQQNREKAINCSGLH